METIEDITSWLRSLKQWKQVEEIFHLTNFTKLQDLQPSKELYESFLIQGLKLKVVPLDFAPAVATAYRWFSTNYQPILTAIAEEYKTFFEHYKTHKKHTIDDLRALFQFCRRIKAPVDWIKQVESPWLLTGEAPLRAGCTTAVRSLFECQRHYSQDYFDFIDYVIVQASIAATRVDGFVKFIKNAFIQIDQPWKDIFYKYSQTEGLYGKVQTIATGAQILGVLTQQISSTLIIDIIQLALKHKSCETIKAVLTSKQINSLQEFQNLLALTKEKQLLKQEEYEKQKQEQAKEEMEQYQKREEEKKNADLKIQEEFKNKEERQEKWQQTLQLYHQLCSMNNRIIDDETFLIFTQKLTEIAAEINITPRPEQLATMFLMVTSTHKRALMQRPTGTGKSLMFGLMSRYVNTVYGEKTVVAVPNEVLAAIQQKRYAPWSSKDIDELYIDNCSSNYCTHSDVLTGNIPFGARVFIDEFDSLFFSDTPIINSNRFLSAILLVNKYKLVGMSATFRGERGLNRMKAFLSDTAVIQTGTTEPERKLQLDVFGNLEADEVDLKVIEVAKQKQQELPVIIILPSLDKCEQLKQNFQDHIVFGKGRVFEQISCLEGLNKISQSPWPVVLTTAETSLGQDLTNVAYVIQATIPEQFSVFMQNAGRSNRIDPDAPLVGALITTAAVTDINSVKQGCEFEQQRQNLFRPDYLKCLQYLECCCLVDPSLSTFKQAFKLFQNGASVVQLYKILAKVQKFKVAIQAAGFVQPCDNIVKNLFDKNKIMGIKTEAAVVIAPQIQLQGQEIQQGNKDKILGKRITRSKQRSNASSQDSSATYYSSSNEAQNFKRIKAIAKRQRMMPQNEVQEVSAFAEDDAQSKEIKDLQLNQGVLKEKEIEEAKAVLQKHGVSLPNSLKKEKHIANNGKQSRTDSVVLFGAKGSNNKRNAMEQDDTTSVYSGTTSKSQYKNGGLVVVCDLCEKPMRKDNLKNHRGGKFCNK